MTTIVGVLLAGGAGRRYGKPKVLVDGWLDIAVRALRDGGCNDVVLVLGAAEVPVPAGVTAVTATDWQQGLSASVRTGLAAAERMQGDYAVMHIVDTPDVSAAVVARVLQRALASRGGLARAYFGDRPGHPVVVARHHWPGVRASISGDSGAGAYLSGRSDVENVDCSDLADGADIDEPVSNRRSAQPVRMGPPASTVIDILGRVGICKCRGYRCRRELSGMSSLGFPRFLRAFHGVILTISARVQHFPHRMSGM